MAGRDWQRQSESGMHTYGQTYIQTYRGRNTYVHTYMQEYIHTYRERAAQTGTGRHTDRLADSLAG